MCFSAEASFTAAAVLGVIGVASIKSVKNPNQYLLASIPLFFAIQQLSEGFVWLNLNSSPHNFITSISVFVFLFFALIIWPLLIPLSMYYLESGTARKRILLCLVALSLPFALGAGYYLVSDHVSATVVNCSIDYVLKSINPNLGGFFLIYYVLLTILPFFTSKRKILWLLGGVILFSLIMTYIFLRTTMVSTWCFFSALMSFIIIFVIRHLNKQDSNLDNKKADS